MIQKKYSFDAFIHFLGDDPTLVLGTYTVLAKSFPTTKEIYDKILNNEVADLDNTTIFKKCCNKYIAFGDTTNVPFIYIKYNDTIKARLRINNIKEIK